MFQDRVRGGVEDKTEGRNLEHALEVNKQGFLCCVYYRMYFNLLLKLVLTSALLPRL